MVDADPCRRPVKNPERRNALRIVDDVGEDGRVRVAALIEVEKSERRLERQGTETMPRLEVFGDGDRDARLVRNERRVRHHEFLEQWNVDDARVFDAAAARADFVRLRWLERNFETLDADGPSVI